MENIRVLYDYQAFTLQTHGGVSRCFAELYKHLPMNVTAEFAVKETDNVYIKGWDGIMPANDRYNKFICDRIFRGKGLLHFWYDKLTRGRYYPDYNQNYSIELLKRRQFDVFHPTFYSDYFLPYLKGKPFVLTIHDMIPELYPQYFARNDWQIVMKQELASQATAIVAVSERTKHDIIRILDLPEDKIHVVYHGCSFRRGGNVIVPMNKPYILYVGDRTFRYKQFNLFVKYLKPFLKSHRELSVVCTGKPFNKQEMDFFVKQGMEERFIHHWVSTDDELFSLYHQAVCFVFPSAYEGFGIPILEAYQADCPILLNNASCFPEIAGDAAIYFQMTTKDSDIVDKLETIYSYSPEDRKTLLSKQRARLARYSWGKSAKQMTDIYRICV